MITVAEQKSNVFTDRLSIFLKYFIFGHMGTLMGSILSIGVWKSRTPQSPGLVQNITFLLKKSLINELS